MSRSRRPNSARGFPFDPRDVPKPAPVVQEATLDPTAAIEAAAPVQRRVYPLVPPLVSAYARMPDPPTPAASSNRPRGLASTSRDCAGPRRLSAQRPRGRRRRRRAGKGPARLDRARMDGAASQSGRVRLEASCEIHADHPDWPMNDWLRRNAEEALLRRQSAAAEGRPVLRRPRAVQPARPFALARALLAQEQNDRANALARKIWREDNLTNGQETIFLKLFGAALTSADSKYRSDRLLYKEQRAAALRAGAMAGADQLALVRLRAAANNDVATDKMFSDAPPSVKTDAASFRAHPVPDDRQALCRRCRGDAAGAARHRLGHRRRRLVGRTTQPRAQADRRRRRPRRLSRRLRQCSAGQRPTGRSRVPRRLDRLAIPERADRRHPAFRSKAMALARTPISRARAAYWRGRGRSRRRRSERLLREVLRSNRRPSTASSRACVSARPICRCALRRRGSSAAPKSVRAWSNCLYASRRQDLAALLVYAAAKSFDDPEQMAAMAQVVVLDRDAKVALNLGKLASQRGFPIDELAFPTTACRNSPPSRIRRPADRLFDSATESAFDQAVSSAGAMGLMQMIASTARRTAQRVGVGFFDAGRMTSDPYSMRNSAPRISAIS